MDLHFTVSTYKKKKKIMSQNLILASRNNDRLSLVQEMNIGQKYRGNERWRGKEKNLVRFCPEIQT